MFYEITKRVIDLIMVTILLIIFFPLLVLIAIAIKLDSSGPVFAGIPRRVGKNGKPFRIYKFRSMIANAHRLMKTDPKFRELYKRYQRNSYKISLREDPRITRVGFFLRRFSLDEVPQLFNVLKGEMSLVGPRAYYPDEFKKQQQVYPKSKKHINKILEVKPGITGYWQVTGRSEINFDKRVKMDADYVNRHSILEDVIIILKTPWAMISGEGAI